jgi:hypothetical protein
VHVHRTWPQLEQAHFTQLVADLEAWLEHVILRHGVEAALILYPEHPRAQQVFDNIEHLTCSALPSRSPSYDEVRDQALRSFVRHCACSSSRAPAATSSR